jgi:pimeloyl-ACP methyl ester carboxylesterase
MSVREGSKAKFVYYSTHGDITNAQRTLKDVQMILIMIHGAGGNADDYFCSATAAIHHQTYFDPDAVLVVAPRFPTEKTTNIEIVDGGIAIRWGDGSDESGIWRYGQSATYPRWLIGESYSSFQALDALIQGMNLASLPLLRHVVIAGHSSGGQFVQRWALMTKVWNNSLFRGVVANPSSFAYLTEERWIDGKWMIPVSTVCPEYNQWPYGYGYDPGGNRSVFYVTSTVNELGQEAITRRFSQRKMFYLAGSLDVCTVPGNQEPAGWCDSHGLETSCSDLLQGQNRLERQQHNMESLARINVTHERIIISGVGHDHSLLFNSDLGLGALFDLESEGMLMSVS